MTPDTPQQVMPMTREEFNQRYWFSPIQMITVVNPKGDFQFMVELRHYFIKGGGQQDFPGVIANVYLDQMAKLIAQDEDNLGFMADPNMKRLYYDRLIVRVKNLVEEHNNLPAYMKHVDPASFAPQNPETPPWQTTDEAAAPVVAPPAPKAPELPAEEEVREFEYDGSKYKMVTTKTGRSMYYKDGMFTSEAAYSKAASM